LLPRRLRRIPSAKASGGATLSSRQNMRHPLVRPWTSRSSCGACAIGGAAATSWLLEGPADSQRHGFFNGRQTICSEVG
ncbi:MAG: hypothetical protein ABWY64_17055, partial [Tardiphaga sp.]